MRPTIDLEWRRDPQGYVLVHEPSPGDDEEEDTPLADAGGYFRPEYRALVDKFLRWKYQPWPPRDPGLWAREERWDSLQIVGKSCKDVPLRPFDGAPNLFRDFAEIQSPEQALAFVNRNGLPGSGSREDLCYILDRAQGAHNLLVRRNERLANHEPFVPPGRARSLGDVNVSVLIKQADPSEAPILIFCPKTLLDGLRLQLAYAFTEERPPRACRQCGRSIENPRKNATYCSPKCKETWFSLERTRRKHRAIPDAPRRSPRSAKAPRP